MVTRLIDAGDDELDGRPVADAVVSAGLLLPPPRSRLIRDSRDSNGSDSSPGVPLEPVFRRRGGIDGWIHLMCPPSRDPGTQGV